MSNFFSQISKIWLIIFRFDIKSTKKLWIWKQKQRWIWYFIKKKLKFLCKKNAKHGNEFDGKKTRQKNLTMEFCPQINDVFLCFVFFMWYIIYFEFGCRGSDSRKEYRIRRKQNISIKLLLLSAVGSIRVFDFCVDRVVWLELRRASDQNDAHGFFFVVVTAVGDVGAVNSLCSL